jgi:DNA primase
MPRIDFRQLRRQVDMGTVLDLLGFVPTQRRGRQVRGPCPVHGRHVPPATATRRGPRRRPRSFSAHLEKNVYRCFHCGASGNQLDLWAAATRQPLYQAAVALCAKLNQPLPRLPRGPCGRKKSMRAS